MKLPLIAGMEALVIGAGKSGIAAVRLLHKKGFNVRLLEKEPKSIPADVLESLENDSIPVLYGLCTTYHCEQSDVIVVSPGIPVQTIYAVLPEKNPPIVIGELELGYTFLDKEVIIAITGTAGKTTTATILADVLKASGLKVFLGGNIGTPLCEYILSEEKADVLVLEVSSFQLQTIHYFRAKIAILLNITPNHLDYHKNMKEYITAKLQILKKQKKDDFAFIGLGVKNYIKESSFTKQIKYCKNENRFAPKYLLGNHIIENLEFVYQAACILGIGFEDVNKVIADYKPLPHRLEFISLQNGTRYINDSKSTSVESLLVALEALPEPIILLAGGKFKGGDLLIVRELLKNKVKQVILFGASEDIFRAAWSGTTKIDYCFTLEEAVIQAKHYAEFGDTVLLSPATSSFDAFSSYIHRGETFRNAVLQIPQNI